MEEQQKEQEHHNTLRQMEEEQKEAEAQAMEYEAQTKEITEILDQIKTSEGRQG